jgi:transglutaminase-like putative cysteine protease
MRIRAGYEITYECPQPTPMLLLLNIHSSRYQDLETPDFVRTDPHIPITQYHDTYGNLCSRLVLPPGRTVLSADFVIRDTGLQDQIAPDAAQHPVEELPNEVIVFLLASRYCETEHLSNLAWSLFGDMTPGWGRLQAILDYAHERITFGYEHARPTKTAFEAHEERQGVCRDYAHLAITLCRCMNIPARYCTGYLGDIQWPTTGEMDFSAWVEVFLGGRWHTVDARHNTPRVGRILMARGRDATDAAITTSFGPNLLAGFKVMAQELPAT